VQQPTEIRVTAVPARPHNGLASVYMLIDVFVAPLLIFVVDELNNFPIADFKAHVCEIISKTYFLP
jgi:hypothetical protein